MKRSIIALFILASAVSCKLDDGDYFTPTGEMLDNFTSQYYSMAIEDPVMMLETAIDLNDYLFNGGDSYLTEELEEKSDGSFIYDYLAFYPDDSGKSLFEQGSEWTITFLYNSAMNITCTSDSTWSVRHTDESYILSQTLHSDIEMTLQSGNGGAARWWTITTKGSVSEDSGYSALVTAEDFKLYFNCTDRSGLYNAEISRKGSFHVAFYNSGSVLEERNLVYTDNIPER